MNKSYIEWIDYYENATKEDVIQDMMLDINSIKEKDKEIERLNNIIDELKEDIEFCLKSIKQEYEMSTDERTRIEMESCKQILEERLKALKGE